MFNKLHFSDSFFVNGAVKITEIQWAQLFLCVAGILSLHLSLAFLMLHHIYRWESMAQCSDTTVYTIFITDSIKLEFRE